MKIHPPKRRLTKALFFLVLNVVSLCLIILACDIYLRVRGDAPYRKTWPGQESFGRPAPWTQPDSALGWTNRPDYTKGEINPQGFRDKRDLARIEEKSGKVRIMVLGDSFVFGVHVENAQTIPGQLEAKLGDEYEVYNLGVSGWGVDQMYLAYVTYESRIRPDIVILAYIDDDVKRVPEAHRNWEAVDKPLLKLANDSLIVETHAPGFQQCLDGLFSKSILLSKMWRQFYLYTEARPIVRHIIRDIAAHTRSRGEEFVIVRIPTTDNDAVVPRLWRYVDNFQADAEAHGALWLEPAETLMQTPDWRTAFYREDGHLNALGYELVSSYIYSRLRDKLLHHSESPLIN